MVHLIKLWGKLKILTNGGGVDAELTSQQQEGFSQNVYVHLHTRKDKLEQNRRSTESSQRVY